MAEKKCEGNCLECSMQQQLYCSSARAYGILKNQESIVARLDYIADKLSEVLTKEELKPIAQNGAGAEE